MLSLSNVRPADLSAGAPARQMIFWYPGEAGSTVEAQGALDLFFDYLNQRIAPDRITGKYFNTADDGLEFIKRSRPAFGIISFPAYEMNRERLKNAQILLQTLPLPDGRPSEIYTIVGKGPKPAVWNGITLYTKQPLTTAFVKKYITGDGKTDYSPSITTVQNILPSLKDAAAGTKAGGVILRPIEYFTLKNMNQPWAKELNVWLTSRPIPSAPFVAFGEEPIAQKVKDILLKMSGDPFAKGVLETLRFKGFSNPQN